MLAYEINRWEEIVMKKKWIAILLSAVMVLGALTGCGDKDTHKEKTKYGTSTEGKFVVGFDQEFPPMGFVGEDGEFTGFDLALAKEVAKRLNLEFVANPVSWDAKDLELSSGTIDCIWNGFTMTGREDDYTFSKPYLNNRQVFVVKQDSGIQKEEDLVGKIVEVQADSSAEVALKEDKDLSSTFEKMQTVPDYNTAMMDLEQGAVDAIAMDEVVAAYQIKLKEGKFKILDKEISSEEYAIGFLKGNTTLKENVEKVLLEMVEDGTMKEISEEWFGSDITILK